MSQAQVSIGRGLRLERIAYDPSAWESIVARFPDAEVYHSPAWLAFLHAAVGAEPVVATVNDGDRLVGYFVGAIVRWHGLRILGSPLQGWNTPRMGFLLVDGSLVQRAADALVPFAFRVLGCQHMALAGAGLESMPMRAAGWRSEGDRQFVVDITGDEDAVMTRMHSNTRRLVRKAKRDGLTVEVVETADIADEYHAQMVATFQRQGLTPMYGAERVRKLFDHVQPSGQLLALRVRDQHGACIATELSVGRGRTAILWGAAFNRDAAELHPNELIHWETMRLWNLRGASVYDMGGGGDYKTKYGAVEAPWSSFHRSRYPGFEYGREAVRTLLVTRQRLRAKVSAWRSGSPSH